MKLRILMLSTLVLFPCCESRYGNSFMDGQYIMKTQQKNIKGLKTTAVSKRYDRMLQIAFIEKNLLAVSFREGNSLLCMYRPEEDSIVKTAIYKKGYTDASPVVGQMTVRMKDGRPTLDVFVLPYGIATVDPERVMKEDRPAIIKYRSYDDYLPYSKFQTTMGLNLNDNILAAQNFDSRVLVNLVDSSGNILKTWAAYDRKTEKKNSRKLTAFLKPDGTKAALLMRHLDKINILNLVDGRHITTTTARKPKPDREEYRKHTKLPYEQWKCYYCNGTVTDSFIYAVYTPDATNEDLLKNETKTYLQIFDWNGNLISCYSFPHNVYCVAVSEENNTIYGLTWDGHIETYKL